MWHTGQWTRSPLHIDCGEYEDQIVTNEKQWSPSCSLCLSTLTLTIVFTNSQCGKIIFFIICPCVLPPRCGSEWCDSKDNLKPRHFYWLTSEKLKEFPPESPDETHLESGHFSVLRNCLLACGQWLTLPNVFWWGWRWAGEGTWWYPEPGEWGGPGSPDIIPVLV